MGDRRGVAAVPRADVFDELLRLTAGGDDHDNGRAFGGDGGERRAYALRCADEQAWVGGVVGRFDLAVRERRELRVAGERLAHVAEGARNELVFRGAGVSISGH